MYRAVVKLVISHNINKPYTWQIWHDKEIVDLLHHSETNEAIHVKADVRC